MHKVYRPHCRTCILIRPHCRQFTLAPESASPFPMSRRVNVSPCGLVLTGTITSTYGENLMYRASLQTASDSDALCCPSEYTSSVIGDGDGVTRTTARNVQRTFCFDN